MEHFLKNVVLLLYTLNEELVKAGRADEQYTLLDINPLLQYKSYAIKVLHQLKLNKVKEGLLETVLGNCEQLFAFNVSAGDAKILEAELQEKITPNHIISQPRLRCYARLAFPGLPLQIASVELAHPASWERAPEKQAQVQMIREINQRRFQPASVIDQHYEQHLRHFLDVETFYKHNIEREVQRMAASAKRAAGSTASAQPTPGIGKTPPAQPALKQAQAGASGEPVGLRTASTVDPQGSPLSVSPVSSQAPQAGGGVSPPGQSKGKRKRSHVRSRRARRVHQQTAPINALAQQTDPPVASTDDVSSGDVLHPQADVFQRGRGGGFELREWGERG